MHLCLIPSHDESRGPSFNRRAERRGSFTLTSRWGPERSRCAALGSTRPRLWNHGRCSPPRNAAAAAGPGAALRCRHTWVLPLPRIPAPECSMCPASPGKAAAPALGGCWSPARRPGGDSRSHRRVAWPGIREMPELEKCAENCSVICSLCSTGTWSWLELKLGSWQQVLSNASPAQAWLKRQMQNGLCTVGLAQLCLGEARSETMLPTGTLGPVDPKPQGAQPRN